LVSQYLSRVRYRIRIYITAFLLLLSKLFTVIGFLSQVALILRNLAVLIVHAVSIKANLFALVSARVSKSILYLLYNIVQGTVK
jgi:hypothetical protein